MNHIRQLAASFKSPRRGRGQSLMELAISLPVLLILLSGVVEFGFALNYYINIIEAVREGARAGVDGDPNPVTHFRTAWNPGDAGDVTPSDNPFAVVTDTQNIRRLPRCGVEAGADAYTMASGTVVSKTKDFYESIACVVVQAAAPTIFDPVKDDILISVFRVYSDTAHKSGPLQFMGRWPDVYTATTKGTQNWAIDPGMGDIPGVWRLTGAGATQVTSDTVMSRMQIAADSAGVLVVEAYFKYNYILGLPWITAFLPPDGLEFYTSTIIPIPAAEPRPTPTPTPTFTVTPTPTDTEVPSGITCNASNCDGDGVTYPLWPVPGNIQAENFDQVAEDGYHDSDGNNLPGGFYRSAPGVDIGEDLINAENGYYVHQVAVGDWMRYSIDVAAADFYDVHLRMRQSSPPAGSALITVRLDGNPKGSVAATNAAWNDYVVPNVYMQAGQHRLGVWARSSGDGGWELDSINILVAGAPPTVTPTPTDTPTPTETTVFTPTPTPTNLCSLVGVPSENTSNGTVSQSMAWANGQAVAHVYVNLHDCYGSSVTGPLVAVALVSSRGVTDTIVPQGYVDGHYDFTVASLVVGTGTYTIRYSLDGGGTWQVLVSAIAPAPSLEFVCVGGTTWSRFGSNILQFPYTNPSNNTIPGFNMHRRLIALNLVRTSATAGGLTVIPFGSPANQIWTGNDASLNLNITTWNVTTGSRTIATGVLKYLQMQFAADVANTGTYTVITQWDDGSGGSICTSAPIIANLSTP